MKDTLVTLDTAKLATLMGFNLFTPQEYMLSKDGKNHWKVDWNSHPGHPPEQFIKAPTQSLLQKWLRGEHGYQLWVSPHPISSMGGWCFNVIKFSEGFLIVNVEEQASNLMLTYEEALEEGLIYTLNLIEK